MRAVDRPESRPSLQDRIDRMGVKGRAMSSEGRLLGMKGSDSGNPVTMVVDGVIGTAMQVIGETMDTPNQVRDALRRLAGRF